MNMTCEFCELIFDMLFRKLAKQVLKESVLTKGANDK